MNKPFDITKICFSSGVISSSVDTEDNPQSQVKAKVDSTFFVDVTPLSQPDHYSVRVEVEILVHKEDDDMFGLENTFTAYVTVDSTSITEEAKDSILNVDVPNVILPHIRDYVAGITQLSGFPPLVLDDYDFEALYEENAPGRQDSNSSSHSDVASIDELPLGYEWIFHRIELEEHGTGFLSSVKLATNSNLESFEDWPIYNNLFRFMRPIEYVHPHYDNCEENFWNILFHLVFAAGENITLVEHESGLPDIHFDYLNDQDISLSDIPMDKLMNLAIGLATTTYTSIGVDAINLSVNMEVLHSLSWQEPPTIEMYLQLMNCDGPNVSKDQMDAARLLYSRIEEYNNKTFLLRFLN